MACLPVKEFAHVVVAFVEGGEARLSCLPVTKLAHVVVALVEGGEAGVTLFTC